MDNKTHIENFLNTISDKIKEENKNKQQTAKDFNIFEILGVAHLEVSTHSAFIANLLNPQGTHSQGTKFLEKFLELIGVKGFDFLSAQVEVEKYVGDLGRIDIFITDNKKWAIVIENKINAGLQEEQLGRYMNFLNNKHKYESKKLVYLTLQNEFESINAEEKLLNSQGVKNCDLDKYLHLTYDNQIIEWLSSIITGNPTLPTKISEIIAHYIQIIKILTNKNNSNTMNDEIKKLISINKEYYNAYKTIVDSFSDLKIKALKDLFEELKKNYTCSADERKIIVKTEDLAKNNIEIWIEFYNPDSLNNFSIGLRKINLTENTIIQQEEIEKIWVGERRLNGYSCYYFATTISNGDILDAVYFHKDDITKKIQETIKICSL